MYRQSFVRLACISLQAIALSAMVSPRSAYSQSYSFVDLNQSRQFFKEGSRRMEREIEQIGVDQKLPKIKLPENLTEKKHLKNLSFVDRVQTAKTLPTDSISVFAIDKYQYDEYDGVGLLTNY